MRRTVLIGIICSLAWLPAKAQQLPQAQDEEFNVLAREWEAVALSLQHFQERLLAYRVARIADRKRAKDLEEYGAKCGDNKGCWETVK